MGRRPKPKEGIDTELDDLPPAMRRREWIGRIEAVLFASPKPVTREVLARVVGKTCKLEELIEDLRDELKDRAFDLVAVAGGWRLQTKRAHADAIRLALGANEKAISLTKNDELVLTAIAYLQPVTRKELSGVFGRDISGDTIGHLRSSGMIRNGPRSPRAGAPYTYVTTLEFLGQFGLESLRDLPDRDALEDAGLLSKESIAVDDALGSLDSDATNDDSNKIQNMGVEDDEAA